MGSADVHTCQDFDSCLAILDRCFGKLNVQYVPSEGADPIQLGQDPGKPCDGGANGWQYTEGNTKIVVCGDACNAVRGAASIDIVLGCATIVTR